MYDLCCGRGRFSGLLPVFGYLQLSLGLSLAEHVIPARICLGPVVIPLPRFLIFLRARRAFFPVPVVASGAPFMTLQLPYLS